LSGAEVLIRWQDPELGWVSPAVFIPLAEERGLIDRVTTWVVDSTCQQLNAWKSKGLKLAQEQGIKLAVNLSARSLYDAGFLEGLINQIQQQGLSSQDFEFELTETGLMRDPDQAIDLLKFLRLSGFKLAIDDFGIGQSSLSYLKNIDADILKIDMFFVRSMLSDKANYAIVKTIISTAKIFGMKTLAEGVEDEAIATELRSLGCDYAQGYFYDAPLLASGFYEKWLRTLNNQQRNKPDISTSSHNGRILK
jgi:EAL domain-containing protein (putative c-di-GMP-specific phosphodiesterase class I)